MLFWLFALVVAPRSPLPARASLILLARPVGLGKVRWSLE